MAGAAYRDRDVAGSRRPALPFAPPTKRRTLANVLPTGDDGEVVLSRHAPDVRPVGGVAFEVVGDGALGPQHEPGAGVGG